MIKRVVNFQNLPLLYKIIQFHLLFFLLIDTQAWGAEEMSNKGQYRLPKLEDVTPEQWARLAGQKIYFGHQSVGENIISGVKLVVHDNPQLSVKVVGSKSGGDYSHPVFGHSIVGKNEHPELKNKDFYETVTNELGPNLDIAFYKFCYIDINSKTDVNEMFAAYKKNIESLKNQWKGVTFVHLTTPLTTVSTGPMSYVRKIIGKNNWGYEENKRRHEYNELLRREYGNKDPLFDLAKLESTSMSGERRTYSYKGRDYFALHPDYASDKGHLNEMGQRYVAEQLLIFLSKI